MEITARVVRFTVQRLVRAPACYGGRKKAVAKILYKVARERMAKLATVNPSADGNRELELLRMENIR